MSHETEPTRTDHLAQDGVTLLIEGTWNARDAATLTGLTPGVLLRSAALTSLTPRGQQTLRDLGVSDVVDLRSELEVSNQGGDAVPGGLTVHLLPITPGAALAGSIGGAAPDEATMASFLQLLRTPGWAEEFMTGIYRELVTDPHAVAQVGHALGVIADAEGATLVHCSAGKDRTGTVVALAATLAGAEEEAVATDFLFSNNSREAQAAVIPDIPGLDPALLAPFLGVDAVSLRAVRTAITEHYGDLDAFAAAAGVGADQVGRLRARLAAH